MKSLSSPLSRYHETQGGMGGNRTISPLAAGPLSRWYADTAALSMRTRILSQVSRMRSVFSGTSEIYGPSA